jgi:hypothetical protein
MNVQRTRSAVADAGWRLGALVLVGLTAMGCGADVAPPFDTSSTGSVEGLVYFDASEDGIFDPSDGDSALVGVGIAVQDRGTGQTFASGGATTDADGRFVVGGIPVGTHDLQIDEASVPTGINICRNPLSVTVYKDETEYADVNGRPGCLITIAAAKDVNLGDFVIVRGIVTSKPNQIESNFSYIEDATAGLFIFGLSDASINVGDQIEVGGTTSIFSGQFQVSNPTVRDVVPNVTTPVPMLVTTAEIAASGSDSFDDLQNRFVRVEKAELVSEFGFGGGNLQNGQIDDGSGVVTIRVDDGVADRNNLNNIYAVGKCYDINGFASNFNGGGQIFPRSQADMVEVSCN